MKPARVALIGARRTRQGLGPFVARDLVALGLDVAAVLGTRSESVESAVRDLDASLGIHPRGYLDLDRLLSDEALDALIVLSPAQTHETYLRTALDAGVHVYCEKPLVWGGEAYAARGVELAEGFRSARQLLAEGCQWPWVLGAFRALHPDVGSEPPKRFGMLLSPASTGHQRIGDCLPHVLSVLQAVSLHARPAVEGPEFEPYPGSDESLRARFVYRSGSTRVRTEVELRARQSAPRPAALEIDGRRAERVIQLPDYKMRLRDGRRSVPLPDPLTARLADFVRDLDAVRGGALPPDPAPIARRLELLQELGDAYRLQMGAQLG